MFKIVMFTFISVFCANTFAEAMPSMSNDKQIQFDHAVCGVVAENYARGQLYDQGLTPQYVESEVYTFTPGSIYSVLVKAEVVQDFLIAEEQDIGFNCFRCPNDKLVVSKENSKVACKNEQR